MEVEPPGFVDTVAVEVTCDLPQQLRLRRRQARGPQTLWNQQGKQILTQTDTKKQEHAKNLK